MIKKSFIILLCLLFLFASTLAPDASARKRRGGPSRTEIWAPAIFFGTIAMLFLIMQMLSSSSQGKTSAKEDKDVSQFSESDSVTEQEFLGQGNIDGVASLSFRF